MTVSSSLKVLGFAIAGALALSPVLIAHSEARACGNSYRYELDPKTNLLVKAEEALSEGNYKQAWRLATKATGAIGAEVEGKDKPNDLASLRARSLRVTSIAAVRTNGEVAGKRRAAQTASWAVEQLRVLVLREGGNPYLQARLAEGLAASEAGRAEALAILSKLADGDLMPDAQAWLLYAELQTNDTERTRGLDKCKLRANDPSICKLEPGQG